MPATNDINSFSNIALAFLMSLLAFAIMLGNAVVILAFVVDKKLRHRSNYFFLNLAISDFFVVSEVRKELEGDCKPEFLKKRHILVLTLLFEFLIPVLLVAYFNMYIYWSLWKRSHLSKGHSGFISVPSSSSGLSFRNGLFLRPSLSNLEESAASLRSEKSGRKRSLLSSLRAQMNSFTASKTSSLSHSDSLALHQREHLELRRGKKLAKSLAILLGVFAVCWAPYSLFSIIRSCHVTHSDPQTLYEITFWLQWFNSFVNPFLYPLCHKRFQKAFLKLFCVKKQSIPSHNRSASS
uniref:Histamine receptor H4 n=1 Tax=Moschus moschiferus TaxID=68415 RepID=A0A8C6DQC1_MOSMO